MTTAGDLIVRELSKDRTLLDMHLQSAFETLRQGDTETGILMIKYIVAALDKIGGVG